MKNDQGIHRRRSIRLQKYDYSQAGAYFITICTQDGACLFGDIVNGEMIFHNAGYMIQKWYRELENKFPDIQCDEFVCMPNHIHFTLANVGADLRVRPARQGQIDRSAPTGSPLPAVVQWFKTMTTNAYIRGVKRYSWPPFPGKLWQRNYWEHVVRNETELTRLREYIRNNPKKWDLDRLNPVGADLRVRPVPNAGQS